VRPEGDPALPPHLVWAPVRHEYPSTRLGLRVTTASLTACTTLALGSLALRALHYRVDPARPGGTVSIVFQEKASVFDVELPVETKAKDPDPGGSEGVWDAKDLKLHHYGNALELAPDPEDTRTVSTLDPSLLSNPSVLFTDSSDGRASRGSGGGQGDGTGKGIGHGTGGGHDSQLLSARPAGGVSLQLEDMSVVYREIPKFPALAKAARLAGNVVVQVLISENGFPLKTEVVSSAHEVFTQEVLRVMPYWRFKPVVVDGLPARVRVRVLFIFTYEEM
jgi:TonB family protein